MSPSALAFILILSVAQVLGEDYSEDEIVGALAAANKVVNSLYERMASQKNRDMEFIESKIKETIENLRAKRDASSDESGENVDKIKNIFSNIKDTLTTFVQNATSSDVYKQVKQFGEDIQSKGKEIGEKIQSAIKNVGNDSN